jgi:SAM-dependent methyltransferase
MPNAFSRIAPPGPKTCKICGELAPVYGEVDFNKSCHEIAGTVLARSRVMIAYNRCSECEFLFSVSFDNWTKQDFLEKIYNDQYVMVDPDYTSDRPASNAGFLSRLFGMRKATLSVLDYGGGNGTLAQSLRTSGFRSADTYDPLVVEFSGMPNGRFAVVSSFETLEHTPDPLGAIQEMGKLVDDPGIVVFSTMVQPSDFNSQGLNWWYVGPRNGHISIFSRKSLSAAWNRFGFTLGSFNDNFHVAFRKAPDFAKHLFRQT